MKQDEFSLRIVSELSGGELQKVVLARAHGAGTEAFIA
jgi:ABC-type Mn2+/Zn2+ transport system ATPase subunit